MYVYKSVAESRVANAHHIINSALTGSRSPAGPRRLGTATHISASLFRRLSSFFGRTPDQDPKAAKLAVLTPGPGMFVNVRNAPRVVIPPSTQNTTCFAVCALVCDPLSRAECVPAFACESERRPFVREVENAMKNGLEQRCNGNFLTIFAGMGLGEKPNFTGRFFGRRRPFDKSTR